MKPFLYLLVLLFFVSCINNTKNDRLLNHQFFHKANHYYGKNLSQLLYDSRFELNNYVYSTSEYKRFVNGIYLAYKNNIVILVRFETPLKLDSIKSIVCTIDQVLPERIKDINLYSLDIKNKKGYSFNLTMEKRDSNEIFIHQICIYRNQNGEIDTIPDYVY